MPEADPLYVFVHLSKTGGTSLYRHLRCHLASEDELVYLGPEGDAERERLGRLPLEARHECERRRVRVLIGHRVTLSSLDLMPWREPRFIFVLREPVSRLISKYNYQIHLDGRIDVPQPFDDWLANLKPNAWDSAFWLCRRFLKMPARGLRDIRTRQRIANRLLEQFYLVTTTERMDTDAKLLFREIGIPEEMPRENVGGRDHHVVFDPDDTVRARIRAAVDNEVAFYRRWAECAPYWGRPGLPVRPTNAMVSL